MSYAPLPSKDFAPSGHPSNQWQADFCGCFDDCESCVCSWFCPCIQFGKNMEDSGLGDCLTCGCAWFAVHYFTGLGFILSFLKRSELRRAYGIDGSDCEDCCVHFWCLACALSQEAREIKRRGRLAAPTPQTVYVSVGAPPPPMYAAVPQYQAAPAAPVMYPPPKQV